MTLPNRKIPARTEPYPLFSTRVRSAVALTAFMALCGLPSSPRAQSQSAGGIVEAIAVRAAAARINTYLEANQPIVRDWSTVYPHVNDLPGQAFRPVTVPEPVWSSALAASDYRSVSLPPGDYAIPLQLYCMHYSGGSAPGFTYLLGPLRGQRAAMITTLMGRASIRHIPHERVQVLAWELQSGQNYAQLDQNSRTLFDQLLPEYRSALGPGFLAEVAQYWQSLAKVIPSLPSLDSAISRLGPASAILASYQNDQRAIAEYAGDYQQLSQHLLFVSLGGQGNTTTIKPWSIVAPGVFERMVTDSTAMGPGTLQIRVLSSAVHTQRQATSSFVPVSFPQTPIARDINATIPIGNVVSYPLNCNTCQISVTGPLSSPATGVLVQIADATTKVQNALENLMWIDCAVGSTVDAVAYVLQPMLPDQAAQAVGITATEYDLFTAVLSSLPNDAASLESAGFEVVAFDELEQQGISCSNHNFITAILAVASHPNIASPFSSASIVTGSTSLSIGSINTQFVLRGSTATTTTNIQISFKACGKGSSCQFNYTDPK